MFFDDDSAVYLAEFGSDATVGGVACRGIFLDANQEAFGLVSGSSLALIVPVSVSASYDTVVVIGSDSYVVRDIQPDGTGFKSLLLEAA